MPARSTTTAGKVKVNLALEPAAYESLRRMAGTERGLGGLVSDLIAAEARRRQEEADVVARLRSGGRSPSPLQEALARLEESEARYDRLCCRLSAAVFEMAPDGQWMFANGALTDLTGFAPEELAGQGWRGLLFPDELQEALEEHCRELRRGDVIAREVVVATKDGRRLVFELSTANHYSPDGTLERVVGFAVEVTVRRENADHAQSRRQGTAEPVYGELLGQRR